MKQNILTPFFPLFAGLLLLLNALAMTCPSCGNDTYDGLICNNALCALSHPFAMPGFDTKGASPLFHPGSSGIFLSAPELMTQTSTDSSSSLPEDDYHAPQWLLNKSIEAIRNTDGVPDLDPVLKEAGDDKSNYQKIVSPQTSENITAVLNSHFHTANHAFIILYFAPNGEGETIQQIILVAVSLTSQIYVLTNVAEYWNTVTLASSGEILEMLGVSSFSPNEEKIYLYSFLPSLYYNRMPSVLEDEEEMGAQ